MKAKSQDSLSLEVLSKFLPVEEKPPSPKVQSFFNLLYSQPPPPFVLKDPPESFLKAHYDDGADISESLAILLATNQHNLESFLRLPSFKRLLEAFSPNPSLLANKHVLAYLQCLQASILHHIDSRLSKQVLKILRILREAGLISFHNEKCIQAALDIDLGIKAPARRARATPSNQSFLQFNPAATVFKEQISALSRAKKLLSRISWTVNLGFLCEEGLVKQVVVIGGKKTGKSTLISTMLYDREKPDSRTLESLAPISYRHGKSLALVDFLNQSQLSLLGCQLEGSTKEEKTQRLRSNKIYEELYETHRIHRARHITIYKDNEILKYVNFTNTPSLVPQTFRHLQIYENIVASQVVCYLVDTEALLAAGASKTRSYDYLLRVLVRLLNRDGLSCIYLIYGQVDKVNLTLRKRKKLHEELSDSIAQRLKEAGGDPSLLQKIQFHYVAMGAAHKMRINNLTSLDSGFDLASSGILHFEEKLFSHLFDDRVDNLSIKLLKAVLRICHRDFVELSALRSSEALGLEEAARALHDRRLDSRGRQGEELESIIQELRQNTQLMVEKLPAKYSSFYISFTNLRDNLYAQFIQSLNYEMRRRTGFNIRRLKTSTVDSVVVGLQGLSDLLQSHFVNHKELHNIARRFDSSNPDSLKRFARSKEEEDLLDILFSHFDKLIHEGYSADSNNIVAEHLSYRLDLILPDNTKRSSINEESIVKPIQASFEYYFLLLERNIDRLFNKRIELFSSFMQRALDLVESSMLRRYTSLCLASKDDYSSLIENL